MSNERAKSQSPKSLSGLLPFLRPYRTQIALAGVFLVMAALATLAFPLALRSLFGQPLLVNFWATWCPPCVEELPLLDGFYQQQKAKGWRLLGIAIDQPSAVRNWLQRSPLSFPIALGGLQGSEMSKQLGNAAGGLPFSVLFSARGEVLERKLGQLSASDLSSWAGRA